MIVRSIFVDFTTANEADERPELVDQLRDARNQIVQLQHELERARGVIADQQSLLVRARATRKVRR